ncbi:leucine-rich repeat domain-containing protein [Massilia rubra]|uniref:Leucine-rich repeat domain-containing protein n=1 Tax=Massilia rubra TaxID=2607910 RepID=A0ABX0LMZ6_9BURK|nr:leucine-rich repeat domain-containing protein [Massilia rubra]NHZ34053.1 leucine-rich repeat domain-containing protein [Massilia rubra]
MTGAVPRIVPAGVAVQAVLGPVDDLKALLGAYSMDDDAMVAILVEGDWSCATDGPLTMEELCGDLAAHLADDKILCAIVITGNLHAPGVVLCDSDRDWAPSLIVGGNVVARSLSLGGGATRIGGDLAVGSTIYGFYNHGSLDVGGGTRAHAIVCADFYMTFAGPVDCAHVACTRGWLTIPVHFEGEAINRMLLPDLLDSANWPIDELVRQTLEEGRCVLLPPAQIGKQPPVTVSRAGRARLAELDLQAIDGPVLRLDLSKCDLKTVPESITRFAGASWLSLAGNRIGRVPDCVAALRELEVLDLSDCGLAALPDWLARLPKLRVLHVAGNDLTAFPAIDGGFAALEELDIGHGFSRSDEHVDWAFNVSLRGFPALRRFANRLNIKDGASIAAAHEGWYSPTLEHLHIAPEMAGRMPDCLARMPQLRSLDLQIAAAMTPSALRVLSAMPWLEAIQFSYCEPGCAFLSALRAALPATLIRWNTVGGQAASSAHREIDSLIYHDRLEEALIAVERHIGSSGGLYPCLPASDHEGTLRRKLDILSAMARLCDDAPLKRRQIGAAADWAASMMARYAGVSAPTLWRLGYELGSDHADCQITQAWWLIRREAPDHAGATALLAALEREVAAHAPHRHIAERLQQRIDNLRALMA